MVEVLYWKLKKVVGYSKIIVVPYFRRFIRLLALPYYYFKKVNWKECKKSKIQVATDLCYIFFKLKYYPDNYSACRFFEKEREEWHKYYGSNYDPYQKAKLSRRLQPVEYEVLFEDKEVCWQLCIGLKIPVPDSYGSVDTYEDYRSIIREVMEKNGLNRMILKPVRGSAGKGVMRVEAGNGSYVIRDSAGVKKLNDFKLPERAILQKVVDQSSEVSSIADASVNTIRIITMITLAGEIIILGSTMRFGIGNSFIDNWTAGGIAVGVDFNKGQLKEVAYDKRGNEFREHPVSKIVFKGYEIPRWKEIVALAEKVQGSFKYFKMLGMDIALSDSGPVIIEINACPDFVFQEQTSGPLLEEPKTLKAFKEYNLFINKYQKELSQNV